MKKTIFIALLLFSLSLYGQKYNKEIEDYRIPKNIKKCFRILDKTMTDNEKYLNMTLPEDSIYFHKEFQYGADFFHAWELYDGSRLTKNLSKKGLHTPHEMYETILISYHRYLNNQEIDLHGQVEKHEEIRQKEHREREHRLRQDSINGIYIPENLDDCFIQLDSLLADNDKQYIREFANRRETIKLHHGLGTWIRNNWGLWGGSRLQRYFIEQDITHPDNMSALILESYYDWLIRENP